MTFLFKQSYQLQRILHVLLVILGAGSVNALSAQCLSGTYTIGGSSPSFTTFTAAVSALRMNGVCSPVEFVIRDGIYMEKIAITEIPGASATNTITFKGSNGSVSNALLKFGASSSDVDNYLVDLDGADHIIFRDLKFERSGTGFYADVFKIRNGANNNTIEKSSISASWGASNQAYLIYSDNTVDNNNKIIDNVLSYGFNAIRMQGTSASALEYGTVISGNHFTSHASSGLWLEWQSGAVVTLNKFGKNNASGFGAISVENCYGSISIESNHIEMSGDDTGFSFWDCDFTGGSAIIANNIINIGSGRGIWLNSSKGLGIYHNTIEASYGTGLYIFGGSNHIFKNNILFSTSTAINSSSSTPGFESDFNDFYPDKFSFNGSTVSNLQSWRTATGKDLNSLSVMPVFVSSFDFHITNDINLDNKGTPVSSVTQDMDGDARSTIKPDIGADERVPPPNDVAVGRISPQLPVCSGITPVAVKIRNQGGDTLTSVVINWKVNDVLQPSFSWSGILPPSDSSVFITIGSYDFTERINKLKIWTSAPNNGVDWSVANDTLMNNQLRTRMSGTYFIGGVPGDYPTFKSAMDELALYGICGPVTVNVRSGIYEESVLLKSVLGASETSRVTIKGHYDDSTMVTLRLPSSSTQDQATLGLFQTGYITFRHITFERYLAGTWDDYGRVVLGGGVSLRFESCIFKGITSDSQTLAQSLLTVTGDSLQVINSRFINGSYGVYSIGRSAQVTNNIFFNQCDYGIYRSGQGDLTISGNHISSGRDTINSSYTPIMLTGVTSSFMVNGNTIVNRSGTGISVTNSTTVAGKKGLIANNFISTRTLGLSITGSRQIDIFNNSINASRLSGRCFTITSSDTVALLNNIFANTASGKVLGQRPAGITSNYNDFYTAGTQLSNSYATLAAWRDSTGHDLNSYDVNPGFASITDLHIASNATLNGKGIPVSSITRDIDYQWRISPPDIGADEFHSVPVYNIGVSALARPDSTCNGHPSIRVIVKNYGNPPDTVHSFDLHIAVNDTLLTKIAWKGTLVPGVTVEVSTGEILFRYGAVYTIKAWTSMPNASADSNPGNDMFTWTSSISMGGTYTIGGNKADFVTFTKAKEALYSLGICDAVTFKVADGTYPEPLLFKNPVPGSDSLRTITFMSANGDSLQAVLTSLNSTIIELDNAPYFRFIGLGIKRTAITIPINTSAVLVKAGSDHTVFSNNNIRGAVDCYSGNNTFSWNYITQGHLRLAGTGQVSRHPGNKLLYNKFYHELVENIITVANQNNVIVQGNHILPFNHFGIMLNASNCMGGTFTGNRLYALLVTTGDTYTGIKLSASSGTAAQPIRIDNNYIVTKSIGAPNLYTCSGIETVNSGFVNIRHNTVLIDSAYIGDPNVTAPLKVMGGDNVNVQNNFLLRRGGDPYWKHVIIVDNLGSISAIDHNVYLTDFPNSSFAYVSGTFTSMTFNAWKSAINMDWNSVIDMPQFVPDSTFTVYKSATMQIGNPGRPKHFTFPDLDPTAQWPFASPLYFSTIPIDIHGEPRNSAGPLIGADEFHAQNDAALTHIAQPTLNPCAGDNPVNVILKNSGSDSLRTIQIHWTINNAVQPVYNWTGSLATGDTANITLGTYTFAALDSIRLKAWAILPNGVQDPYPSHDTVKRIIQTALSGTYTIGGSSPDFPTFTAAINALHYRGVCTAVVFNARPGTYNEKLVLRQVANASNVNTITFQSETLDSTSVVITEDPINYSVSYVLYLNGADHIRINRLWLKNINTGNSLGHARVLLANNGSNDLEITNNIIESVPVGSGYFEYDNAVYIGSDYLESGNNSDVLFRNNHVKHGANGFGFRGGEQAGGGFQTSGVRVENNIFEGHSGSAVSLSTTISPVVIGNIIRLGVEPGTAGIEMADVIDTFKVINNKIENKAFGVWVNGCNSRSGLRGLVANNSVFTSGISDYATGIELYSSSMTDVVHNSFYSDGLVNRNSALAIRNSNNINILNNIFFTTGAGYAAVIENSHSYNSNYNNLYSSGASFISLDGEEIPTLFAWRSASGSDTRSTSYDPRYVSVSDLHFTNAAIDDRGLPVSTVAYDMNGAARSLSKPDIGCYEVTLPPPSPVDAAVSSIIQPLDTVCPGMHQIRISIANNGPDTLTSVDVEIDLNGEAAGIHPWSGTLAPAAVSSPVDLGSFTWLSGLSQVRVWVSRPNGGADPVNSNDTLKQDVYAHQTLPPDLGPDTGSCPGKMIQLNAGNYASYLWSTGETAATVTISPGTYNVVVTDFAGCTSSDTIVIAAYPAPPIPAITASGNFLISSMPSGNQWYMDNIAIAGATNQYYEPPMFGNYSVSYTDNNGCMSYSQAYHLDVKKLADNNLTLKAFPNPVTEKINLSITAGADQEVSISITDILGRTVGSIIRYKIKHPEQTATIDMESYAPGVYYLRIMGDNSQTVLKVQKN